MSDTLPPVSESFADLEGSQPYDWQNVPHYRGGNRVTRNRLNPGAKSPVSRAAKAVIKAPVRVGRGVTGKGRGASGDTGYWNLVIAECLLLFVLYVIAHNEVQTWANILFWRPAAPIQVGSPITATGAGSQALGGNAAGGAAPAGVTALTPGGTPQLPGALMWPSNFLNNGIDGAINQLNRWATGAVTGTTSAPMPSGPSTAATAAASGGILGNNFWQSPVGAMLKRWGM